MQKFLKIIGVTLFLAVSIFSLVFSEETFTITTYYPSPYGSYNDLYVANRLGIGTASPQGALDVVSTTGAFIVPRMTTAQRDALTAVNGMIIYNTTTNQFNFRENGAWVLK